ncbi:MAG: O-antigen ligase family protein [Prevotella sp.]|nr:O-antigen ligase family protein [Prevotella sp.]
MARVLSNSFTEYTHENGGRVLLLFLLFLLAIYEFITAGFPAFAVVCLLPFLVLFVYVAFTWRMFTFWVLIFVNYFIQMHGINPPGPMSLYNEILQIILLAIAIIDTRQNPHFERVGNVMLLSLVVWCSFCTIEILNDTCGLGINIGAWYTGARMMAFQLLYIFLVFSIYISSPEILKKYLIVWALLSLFSAIWTWKQQNIGLTPAENSFLYGRGRPTHIIQGGTLIRYFSTFSDAANYGCNAAASAVAFLIIGITTKIKWERWLFIIIALLVIKSMFASGTRTAIFCMAGGFAVYLVLSKSIKIAIPAAIVGALFFIFLAFTNIANGNQQIRRMRSAFNKSDASTKVRDINQETMRKYMQDAPWGIGLGMGYKEVPANNKYNLMATIPPDSEYVYIWLRTGRIGITLFIIITLMMFGGACRIVLFRLKSKSLMGIGGGLCSAFVAIQLGGYANQVLMQFPNGLIFYGGLTIVYLLPYIEPEWIKYENNLLAKQEEKKRLKLEKKLASRV